MTTLRAVVSQPISSAESAKRTPGWIAIALMGIALIYAFLGGLRTVTDYDLGWQLATGRWVVQHHQIPSTDFFSYTAAGRPWIYPVGCGLLFYGTYLLGGYVLLSWFAALMCAGTAALLLRRASVVSCALVVFAIPLIAVRITPRADMFTVVLFAAFLTLLWQQHESGHAPLWLLPPLMMCWVNLHLGFLAGLALLCGYIALEVLEAMSRPGSRRVVTDRLGRAWPWLMATLFATLLNPWGWKIYQALLRQESAMGLHSQAIAEWTSITLTWDTLVSNLSLRNPTGSFALLLLVAAVAVPVALFRRRFGAVALLVGGAVLACRHVRFETLFAIIVVIVGGAVLTREFSEVQSKVFAGRTRSLLAMAAALFIAALACVRSADLVTDRFYLASSDTGSFGAGLSWWFPEPAAAFLERVKPPGEIFNGYNEGGYIVWRLGPSYRDYIDGRAIPFGTELFNRNGQLLGTPPESPEWQHEAERYHINSIIVPLGRYVGVRTFPVLRQFCNNETWLPVYLDEVSAVFMWRTSETQRIIDRYQINCATAPLPATTPAKNDSAAFNQWSNAAAVLHELGRNSEAFAATTRAVAIFPDSGFLHFLRGDLLAEANDLRGAEQSYRLATALQPNEVDWSSLARLYQREGRFVSAMEAWEKAAALSASPALPLLSLGYAALDARQPQRALSAFDRALAEFQRQPAVPNDNSFSANLAHGRSRAWIALGDMNRAVTYEEETVRLTPERSEDWLELSNLYARQGRLEEARRARERATVSQNPKPIPGSQQ